MFKFINKIRNKEYSKEKGFSLLELSVAVGIAAIVGAAGIVATTGFIGSAETKKDNYVANAERAIADAESSSLALGETSSTGGEGNSSGEEGTEAEETPVAPGAPTTVLASGITSTGATLTWSEPETGEVGEYIVTLNGDVQGTEPIPNDVFSYDFTSLTTNTDYEAKVFAKSNDGTLSEAATEKFYTAFRPMVATGGDKVHDIVQDGIVYRVHEFTTVGESSFEVQSIGEGGGSVEYLVVAGGGGGKPNTGGGGGAGGYRSSVVGEASGGNSVAEPKVIVESGSYAVIVGAGGAVNQNGENSEFDGIVSLGGGTSGTPGGSGGGMQGSQSTVQGSGTAGQGNDGGAGRIGSGNAGSGNAYATGGGGGALTNGQNSVSTKSGDGGDGISSSITGNLVTRAGGGGGGADSYRSRPGGAGGLGGGGDGSSTNTQPGGPGLNSFGGGGGGGANRTVFASGSAPSSNDPAYAYPGGSGIVVVRYPIGTLMVD